MQEQIIELQTKLAYQEDLLQSLNEVVTQQQDAVARLEAKVARLEEQLMTAVPSLIASADQETPPPHY